LTWAAITVPTDVDVNSAACDSSGQGCVGAAGCQNRQWARDVGAGLPGPVRGS
jgi:hypothetical protein